jgi:hypothetical protein
MDAPSFEHCPACGSGDLVLLGRFVDGSIERKWLCLHCRFAWPEAALIL